MPEEIKPILKELKKGLKQIYGAKFKKAYLYGSHARGDYTEDSDIDILIVLANFKKYGEELRRTTNLVGGLSLEYGVTVSVVFSREKEWKHDKLPLLMNIRADGIAV
ncbi:MAG: nucleotidyltransferase domain-containing protein [Chloroflexi bacterium]|nr:nucleotidyltransferase domain-containing protein [Chloroflexota bacterium]